MSEADDQVRQTLAARLVRSALWVGIASLSFALIGPIAPVPLGIPMAVVGLSLFAAATLISSYVMLTKEMKSAEELGFKRTRDAIVYASSTAGMNWRIVALSFSALAASFLIGFGLLGASSSSGSLLAFGTFAYLTAIARLQRRWPKDKRQGAD